MKMKLTQFTGTAAFGLAYQRMMERDVHAKGSVDRVLASRMVRLCEETADYLYSSFTPLDVAYVTGSRPKLDNLVKALIPRGVATEDRLGSIITFTRNLAIGAEQDLTKMRFGGTEEQIITRKSDWCTDIARVACLLCQVAGFPCRLVHLFDLDQAYSGHVIIEAHRDGRWGALDSSTAVAYVTSDGKPASVWQLMNNPTLIDQNKEASGGAYTTPGQFRAAGHTNYFAWNAAHYVYTVTGVDSYNLSILSMSNRGWPGGLRWLHGEDKDGSE